MDHPTPLRRPDPVLIDKKITCRLMNFAVPVDNWVKIKESENKNI